MSVSFDFNDEPAERATAHTESRRPGLPVPLGWTPSQGHKEPEDSQAPIIDLFAIKPERDEPISARRLMSAPRDWRRIAAAASLATVVMIGVAAAAVHIQGMRVASADGATEHALADRIDAMSTRIESLEANRSHDEIVNLRKVLTEIKSSVASTRNVGDGLTQISSRVDRLEKEQGGKLDKLGDRIDHDAAGRIADVTARLEKLEIKANAANARDLSGPVAQLGERLDHLEKDQAARLDKLGERLDHQETNRTAEISARVEKLEAKAPVAAIPAPPSKPTLAANTATTKIAPSVSDEMTASIGKPRPRLQGYYLSEVHNGYAMIDSPAGEIAVAPGDRLPGGGRVLRIERHGHEWSVVTTEGQIVRV